MQTNDNNVKNQSQEAEETGNKQTFYLQIYTADDDAAFKTDPSNQKKSRWLTFRAGGIKSVRRVLNKGLREQHGTLI